MGTRYLFTVVCSRCGTEDKDVYYAPTCGFVTHFCSGCGFEIDLETCTKITYGDASNQQEIEYAILRKECVSLARLVNSLATIIINHADCVSSNDLDVANDAVELVAPLLV